MADNRSNRGGRDRSRVASGQGYELGYFARKHALRMNKRIDKIPKAVVDALCAYPWPGNVRELEHTISRDGVESDCRWRRQRSHRHDTSRRTWISPDLVSNRRRPCQSRSKLSTPRASL